MRHLMTLKGFRTQDNRGTPTLALDGTVGGEPARAWLSGSAAVKAWEDIVSSLPEGVDASKAELLVELHGQVKTSQSTGREYIAARRAVPLVGAALALHRMESEAERLLAAHPGLPEDVAAFLRSVAPAAPRPASDVPEQEQEQVQEVLVGKAPSSAASTTDVTPEPASPSLASGGEGDAPRGGGEAREEAGQSAIPAQEPAAATENRPEEARGEAEDSPPPAPEREAAPPERRPQDEAQAALSDVSGATPERLLQDRAAAEESLRFGQRADRFRSRPDAASPAAPAMDMDGIPSRDLAAPAPRAAEQPAQPPRAAERSAASAPRALVLDDDAPQQKGGTAALGRAVPLEGRRPAFMKR